MEKYANSLKLKKPAKQVREDAQDTRLLDAAAAVFLEKGFAASSVDEVASRAKASKITYYKHYGNKKLLFEAVVLHQNRKCLAGFASALQANVPLKTALPRFAKDLVAVLLSSDGVKFIRLLHAEADRFPELAKTFDETGPQKANSVLASYLRAQMVAGVLRKSDPSFAAEHLYHLTTGELTRRILLGLLPYPTEAQVRKRVNAGVKAFLRAYAP